MTSPRKKKSSRGRPAQRFTTSVMIGAFLFGAAPAGKAPLSSSAWAEGDTASGDADSLSDLEQVIQDPSSAPASGDAGASAGNGTREEDALLDDAASGGATNAAAPQAEASAKEAPAAPADGTGGGDDLDLPADDGQPVQAAGAGAPANAPQATAEAQAAPPAENEAAPTGEKNNISNIEFKMEGPTSRIVVHSHAPLQYREVKSPEMRQVVYYFDNAEAPQRIQRAFDTSEFSSPVALFTLLQMPQTNPPLTKLIVQLRENKAPVVVTNPHGLYIDFPPPDHKGEPKLIIGEGDGSSPVEGSFYNPGKGFSNKTLKLLEVKNSDIQDVLRMLAKTSGYNIIVGDDVSGKVGTLSLQNVPWDQAFTLVLQSKKLGYIRQGGVIRVATLTALKAEKEDELANEQARIRVEPLRTVLIPISYGTVSDMASRAKPFLTQRGSVDTDMRTNTIILKDIDSVVQRVQKLFAALDTQPPSVSISAKIVEMSDSFSRNIGFNQIKLSQNTTGLNIGQSFDFGGGTNIAATTLRAADFANLDVAFSIGETDNKVRTLANPTVSVVANQTAQVNQTITIYVENASFGGAGGAGGGGGQPGANGVPAVFSTITPITATLSLNVTPIVANDGSISMKVNAKNEVPSGSQVPISIDSRAVNTQLRLDNGDTAVLGGIFQNTVTDTKRGLPFLMKIPILGFFLSGDSTSEDRSETYIFLTAKILNPEEAFKRSF